MVGEDLWGFLHKQDKQASTRRGNPKGLGVSERPFPEDLFCLRTSDRFLSKRMHCKSQATAGHMAHCGLHIGPTLRRCPSTQCAPGHRRVRADGIHLRLLYLSASAGKCDGAKAVHRPALPETAPMVKPVGFAAASHCPPLERGQRSGTTPPENRCCCCDSFGWLLLRYTARALF